MAADRFTAELSAINQALPSYVKSITSEGEGFLLFRLRFGRPFEDVLCHYSESFRTHYPNGDVTMVINNQMRGMPASSGPTFGRICSTLQQMAQREGSSGDGAGAGGDSIEALFPAAGGERPAADDASGMMGGRAESSGGGMMGRRSTSMLMGAHAPSRWQHEPTVEADISLEAVRLNATLSEHLTQLEASVKPIDIANIDAGLITVTVTITLAKLAAMHGSSARGFQQMMAGYEMSKDEAFIFRFTVDPVQYPKGTLRVDFGQPSNFSRGVFPGAVGQLRRVLSGFCSSWQRIAGGEISAPVANLMQEGFAEEEVLVASKKALGAAGLSPTADKAAEQKVRAAILAEMGGQIDPSTGAATPESAAKVEKSLLSRQLPPAKMGAFLSCLHVVLRRLSTLADYCVICDRQHVFSVSAGMCGVSVCTRASCQFRFSKLDVARDVATQSAMQTGVMDLLIVLARAAALSSRYDKIFDPYPTLVDSNGSVVESPDKKDIEKCRTILRNFPMMKRLAGSESQGAVNEALRAHHPLAQSMFHWIIGSNKTTLTKINPQHTIGFMGTKHQFRLQMLSPERQARFEELKKKHGAKWCFHGSRMENWHAILRNGLKNVSGTGLQVNGAAYGSGIYLSPSSSTSWSYSQMQSNPKDHQLAAHMAEEYIDPNADVRIMAIAEVVAHELKESGNVWVMPHNDHVSIRFFFVFTHGFTAGYNVSLNDENKKRILSEALALTEA